MNDTISRNISASGLLFNYNEALDRNTLVIVRFLIPNSFDFFESKARVVRFEIHPDNKTYNIGVEFIDLNEEEQKNLNYYISK